MATRWLVLLLLCAAARGEQLLMIPDSAGDRIMLFHAATGALIDADFIRDAGGAPYDFQAPKDAIQVGGEIWVTDQSSDAIFRFDLQGAYISAITEGLDNLRGMEWIDDVVYVCNAGTGNGAPGEAILRFTPEGMPLASFAQPGSPFDVFPHDGELLISDSSSNDVERWTAGGAALGRFENDASGLAFPQQIARRASNGNLLVAGFSGGANAGIYEFDAGGAQVALRAAGVAVRGVYELSNGRLLFTTGSGTSGAVRILDPASGQIVDALAGGITPQFVNLLTRPGGCDGALRGDANCDGAVDNGDIDCFVAALIDAEGDVWRNCALATNPDCVQDFLCINDANGDGAVDNGDIDAFIDLLL